MDTKLTLYMDRELIKKAKVYARSKGRSLSDLTEAFYRTITEGDRSAEAGRTDETGQTDEEDFSEIVKSLHGAFRLPEDFDYKSELAKKLKDKHFKS